MSSSRDARVYVGNLPPDVREKDVQGLFWKYGSIKHVTLKNQKGPPFAFVEFHDYRNAEDAVNGRNGYNYDGYRLRTEHPKSMSSVNGRVNQTLSYHNSSNPKRTDYRVIVTGLPPSGSWQDLKDHMREAGDVCFADIDKNGHGVVEFQYKSDVKYAVRLLDNTKFKSHEGETSYIRVRADDDRRRSRSRSRRRSPSRSSSSSRSISSPRHSSSSSLEREIH